MSDGRTHLADHPYDAVVVGAGPNGLAAAITLAEAGRSVLVIEAEDRVGGGARSDELTLPGFVHDTCSAVHPLAVSSPFFQRLPLDEHGLRFVHPDVPVAHPLDGGTAAMLHRSVDETAAGLGPDADAWRRLMAPLVAGAPATLPHLLGPLRPPRHPLALARFGWHAVRSAQALAGRFEGEHSRALIAGLAAHAMQPLTRPATAGFALLFAVLGQAGGWPVAAGGSQAIADALASYLRLLGGEIRTGWRVRSIDELPHAGAVLFDVTPIQLLGLAGHRLPDRYRRRLRRFRYGPGAFKVDFALDGPIPWAADGAAAAGTVHVGGTFEEVAAAEAAVAAGKHPERPFVLVAQQSLFDPTRAPEGRHTAWAYCHVPNGSTRDMTGRLEAQIERFAPGFGERVLARCVRGPLELQRHNTNLVGGDINGGSAELRQLVARPVLRVDPYATPARGIFLCSASTPPGGGVHGMCGHHAARSVLRRTG